VVRVTPASGEGSVDAMEKFRLLLSTHGLKFTEQRRAIGEVFFSVDRHLSLLEILDEVRRRQRGIGYATVYRTMRLLSEGGLAEEHRFDGGQTRYEPVREGGHHDHLVCLRCGFIVEFEDELIEDRQRSIAAAHGFAMRTHRHEIYGLCNRAECDALGAPDRVGE
jgi:Fur family ferric uptake transcriptional regulator